MLKGKQKLILLFLIVILTFIFGMRYELDYRILTRRTVKYLADYELGFYGGKDLRLFETHIAFILTLIPIGFYFISRQINSLKKIIGLILVYLISIPLFYCIYCFFETKFIEITITNPILDDGVFQYHQNNVNYRMILLLTIISTFIIGVIFNKITNKKKPVANNE